MDAERFAAIGLVAKGFGQGMAGSDDRLAGILLGSDRQDDDLLSGHAGWKHQSVIVRVGHDQGADQAGGYTPRSGVGVLDLTVAAGERDILGFGEILSEVM